MFYKVVVNSETFPYQTRCEALAKHSCDDAVEPLQGVAAKV